MKKQAIAGFTLIEVLAVVVMLGVLAAIATPSWVAFNERQRLNAANNQIYQALRQAQSNAKLKKETWQVSFKQSPGGALQWAVQPYASTPLSASSYNSFPNNVVMETGTGTGKTTFSYSTTRSAYEILFNYKGCPIQAPAVLTQSPSETCTNSSFPFAASYTVANPPPRIMLSNKNGGTNKRCVMVLTRLGAIQIGQDADCF
jgi:prepilin-type N-terminal cleavage/methylation domain-containing protein